MDKCLFCVSEFTDKNLYRILLSKHIQRIHSLEHDKNFMLTIFLQRTLNVKKITYRLMKITMHKKRLDE